MLKPRGNKWYLMGLLRAASFYHIAWFFEVHIYSYAVNRHGVREVTCGWAQIRLLILKTFIFWNKWRKYLETKRKKTGSWIHCPQTIWFEFGLSLWSCRSIEFPIKISHPFHCDTVNPEIPVRARELCVELVACNTFCLDLQIFKALHWLWIFDY